MICVFLPYISLPISSDDAFDKGEIMTIFYSSAEFCWATVTNYMVRCCVHITLITAALSLGLFLYLPHTQSVDPLTLQCKQPTMHDRI